MKSDPTAKSPTLTPTLWLVGYGAWPVKRRASALVETLGLRGVSRLIDIRLSPCGSDVDPARPYGPRPWNLQASSAGIVGILNKADIAYEWLVELGNPQRKDPTMTVLRSHLADFHGRWPVHQGLKRLADLVRNPSESVAILCACGDARRCHRTVVAEALAARHFGGALAIREVFEKRNRSPQAEKGPGGPDHPHKGG